jgi:hypothetical protein
VLLLPNIVMLLLFTTFQHNLVHEDSSMMLAFRTGGASPLALPNGAFDEKVGVGK